MKVNRNKTPYFEWYDDEEFTREHHNRLLSNLSYVFHKRFKGYQFFKIKTDEPGTKPIYVRIDPDDVCEVLYRIHNMLQTLCITVGYEVYGLRNSNGISIILRAWGEDEDDKLRFEFVVTPCAESKYIKQGTKGGYIKHCTAGHE